jgi:hypothetical protein
MLIVQLKARVAILAGRRMSLGRNEMNRVTGITIQLTECV